MATRCPAVIIQNQMGWMRRYGPATGKRSWIMSLRMASQSTPTWLQIICIVGFMSLSHNSWWAAHLRVTLTLTITCLTDLDHDDCNEPSLGNERQMGRSRESGSQSAFKRVLPKRFRRNGATPIQRSAFTVSPYELRGRPVARVSVPETTVSAGSSPQRCKWTPIFMENMQRFLSPLSWFKCNGKCSLPTEGGAERAHVVSLSACKDNESAFDDDDCNGTVTKFFIEHLRTKPKSTLRELLLAIRQRVDKITAERQALDMKNQVISRRSTFANGRKIRTEWTPKAVRRNTEVNASTLDELFQFTPSSTREDKNKYSQKPSYSSHYRLNLDELVDI
ncbi:hypothetical protein JVT61DRAFT_15259 [Boletus reticuloceps]|uniref:Uncharacterized protein n=1 Tax=Boletus reticuloceps TaxID=495285 RepID=A0A8I3AA10_9AGAM|nr:hypothetical protein JVT61DRAFT_15259 [Boletus reticuloceps]